jgi:hypothetical protein
MRHPEATPLRGVFCGARAVSLRPSLGAAATLEGRYGFQKLFEAVGDGNLTVIADVIETSSECEDFLKAIADIPLIEIMRNVIETTTKHILALAGADQDQTDSDPHSGQTMPFSDYHKRLYQLGTGWLGWTPSVTWQSTPSEILGAYGAHIEQLQAIYGTDSEEQERRTAPDNTSLDRVGLARLKAMTGKAR